MDEIALCAFSNGNHYSTIPNENESEMFDDDEVDENEQLPVNYQPVEDEPEQRPVQPVQNERGGRRKGVPRRLQLSPDIVKTPTQRLLPLTLSKSGTASVHHHEQPILTSDQEDDNEAEEAYQQNKIEQNYLQLDLASKDFVDNNNNLSHHNDENEDILEIVDDILADMVSIIVRDVKQQRRKLHQKQMTNGTHKVTNGKHHANGHTETKSAKVASKQSDSSTLMNDLSKTTMSMNSSQQLMKHKRSPSSSVTSSPVVKRQKTFEASPQPVTSMSMQQQQQQQQLLWEMTQQLMMSAAGTDPESLAAVNSSLLKQQLLGLTHNDVVPKQKARPSKTLPQSPVMHSNSNLNSNSANSSTTTSPYDRGGFAPRRRGRPPKYVTDRALSGLSSLDLDQSALTASYDQLLSAIENGMGVGAGGASSAAFQTALASMLGQQAGLTIPPAPVARNGVPASMVKNNAGQTRHSLPASSMTSATKLSQSTANGGLDMPMMATKKRGPGRPPKSQTLFDPHQILQATQRLNSSASANHFPPTMVPPSAGAFNFNAAFAEMLQQQHQH